MRNAEFGMRNDSNELLKRTKAFALCTIEFVESLPSGKTLDVLGRQLLRSATSVGANYRAACRAKSRADFVNKMGTVEEEADESAYWLELMREAGLTCHSKLAELEEEAGQITAMVVASIKSARSRMQFANSALRTPHSAFS